MRRKQLLTILTRVLAIMAVAWTLHSSAWAQTKYKVLCSFWGNPNAKDPGLWPAAGLTLDAAGNLYGTTSGETRGYGSTVFKLTPNPDGSWTWSMIANLGWDWTIGTVVFDSAGDLYGTSITCCSGFLGPFELTPNSDGTWTEIGLPTTYGEVGYSKGLAIDAMGNLYGTFDNEGNCYGGNCGGVFELTPNPNGSWTNEVLYTFQGLNDGALPYSVPFLDAAGNLYGTTSQGGAYGYGTIWELKPQAGGGWVEHTLYAFNGAWNGANSTAGLNADISGNFYGTTSSGGAHGYGTVFMLGLTDRQIRVLHQFTGGSDGANPNGVVTIDVSGNVYGATPGGGAYGDGVVFKLTPGPGGGWAEQVLHNFTGGNDGAAPNGGLIFDPSGNLYGTTWGGGRGGYGVVFEITP